MRLFVSFICSPRLTLASSFKDRSITWFIGDYWTKPSESDYRYARYAFPSFPLLETAVLLLKKLSGHGQDPYADASIGNITGSNSVNVFLGLGLSGYPVDPSGSLRGFFRIRAGDWRLGAISHISDPGSWWMLRNGAGTCGVLPGFLGFHMVSREQFRDTCQLQHMDNGTGFFGGKMTQFSRDHCEALVYRSYLLGCVSW